MVTTKIGHKGFLVLILNNGVQLRKGSSVIPVFIEAKPTDISFAISSGLLGSTVLVFFNGLDDDPPLGVVFWRFVPPCMIEELGG